MKTRFFTKQRALVLAVAGALLALTVAATGFAGIIVHTRDGAAAFAATFEARAVANPETTECRSLPAVQKLEGRYAGTMSVGGEDRALNFSLEALYDRSAGLGTAQGKWQLVDRATGRVAGSGELVAVVKAAETTPPDPDVSPPEPDIDPPDPDVNPPDPDLELHGLLIGTAEPPEPDLPAQRLVANFAGAITDGTLNFSGAVGDPTGLSSNPAALFPAVKC